MPSLTVGLLTRWSARILRAVREHLARIVATPVDTLPHGRASDTLERTHPACGSRASCSHSCDDGSRPPLRSGYRFYGAVGLLPTPCSLAAPYFILTTLACPVR